MGGDVGQIGALRAGRCDDVDNRPIGAAAVDPVGRDQIDGGAGERIGRAAPIGELAIAVRAIAVGRENAFDLVRVVEVEHDRNMTRVAEQIVADDVAVLAAVDLRKLANLNIGRIDIRRQIDVSGYPGRIPRARLAR